MLMSDDAGYNFSQLRKTIAELRTCRRESAYPSAGDVSRELCESPFSGVDDVLHKKIWSVGWKGSMDNSFPG
jgi:hypothetical protein